MVTQVLRDLPPGISTPCGTWSGELIAKADPPLNLPRGGELEDLGIRCGAHRFRSGDIARLSRRPGSSGLSRPQRATDRRCDLDGQLREFGVNLIDSDVECTHERMLAGSRRGYGAAAIINRTPRTSTAWGRRFESIRALGHHERMLLDSYGPHLVRRRRSRRCVRQPLRSLGRGAEQGLSRRNSYSPAKHWERTPTVSIRMPSRRGSCMYWRGMGSAHKRQPITSGTAGSSQALRFGMT